MNAPRRTSSVCAEEPDVVDASRKALELSIGDAPDKGSREHALSSRYARWICWSRCWCWVGGENLVEVIAARAAQL